MKLIDCDDDLTVVNTLASVAFASRIVTHLKNAILVRMEMYSTGAEALRIERHLINLNNEG